MAAIDFPNSPTLNQEFSAGGRTWKWDGSRWLTVASTTIAPTTHASSHGEAGTDPVIVTQNQVTNLITDLATKAPTASPTFSGTVTMPLTTAGYVKTTSGGVVSSSAAVPQADVTNLTTDLAGKAASVHTHAQSDVTGLTTALAGKAAVGDIGNADFNTALTSGFYRFGVPAANGPGFSYGQVIVSHDTGTTDTIAQIAIDYATAMVKVRAANGIGGTPSWTAWKSIAYGIGAVTYSTADPSGGIDGDVWLKYTP